MEINHSLEVLANTQSRITDKKNETSSEFSQLLQSDEQVNDEQERPNEQSEQSLMSATGIRDESNLVEQQLIQSSETSVKESLNESSEIDDEFTLQESAMFNSVNGLRQTTQEPLQTETEESIHLMLSRATGDLLFNAKSTGSLEIVDAIKSISTPSMPIGIEQHSVPVLLNQGSFSKEALRAVESFNLLTRPMSTHQTSQDKVTKASASVLMLSDKELEKKNLVLIRSENDLTVFYRDFTTQKSPGEIAKFIAETFSKQHSKMTIYVNGHQFSLGD